MPRVPQSWTRARANEIILKEINKPPCETTRASNTDQPNARFQLFNSFIEQIFGFDAEKIANA